MAQCVDEHEALIAEAGGAARALVRPSGWIRCLRIEASLREKIAEARGLDQYGIDYAVLTGAQLRAGQHLCLPIMPSERSAGGGRRAK